MSGSMSFLNTDVN